MSYVAAAIVGTAVVSGVSQSRAAGKAAKAQIGAASQANETERYIFDEQRKDQLPWQQAGKGGLMALGGLYGFTQDKDGVWSMADDPSAMASSYLTKDPGYQFGLQEGQRNLENSAAARGGLLSGNFLKASTQYGQDYATTNYDKIANRYSQLAGVGQTANAAVGQAGQNYANAYGANVTNAGNARASGYIGQANAISGALNQGVGTYGLYKGGYFGK